MDAAIDEFAERGIELASYNRIIERSGLSKGAVYYYFDNKDSLLLTVLSEICEMFRRSIGDLEMPDTKEKYWAIVKEYNSRAIHFFFENPKIWRILCLISRDAPHMGEQLDSLHNKAMSFIDNLTEKGREVGAVRKDLPLKTLQRLIHSLGKELAADLIGECEFDSNCNNYTNCIYNGGLNENNEGKNKENEDKLENRIKKDRLKIEKFIATMHDLSKRILTPKGDFACFTNF